MPKNEQLPDIDRRNRHLLTLRRLQRELPQSCVDFLIAIESQSSVLTRLNYAYDLRVFFHYLSTEVTTFAGKEPLSFAHEDLSRVTKGDIERYSAFLSLYFKNIHQEDGEVFSIEMENHEYGKMRKLSSLRSFFRYLFSDGRIEGNVVELVPLPKIHEKVIVRLEIDEMVRMLDLAESGDALSPRQQKYHQHTQKRDLAILSLFLGTGIRVSECIGLDMDDLDFEQNAFIITRKGGQEAMLYFSDEVAGVLLAYLEDRKAMEPLPGHEQALFLSLQNKRISVRAVENLVKKYASVAAPLKKKISPHKLRSTFGTNLYQTTGDIYLVADVLGHTNVNTTRKHYAAMSEENRRTAAKVTVLREEKK